MHSGPEWSLLSVDLFGCKCVDISRFLFRGGTLQAVLGAAGVEACQSPVLPMAAAGSSDKAPLPTSACCSSEAELPATKAAAKPKGGKRPRRPDIDLDSSMRRAREEVKKAAAEVARHRAQIRSDKQKNSGW